MKNKKSLLAITGSLLNMVSLIALNFASYRPNRIMSGTDVSSYELLGGYLYGLLIPSAVLLVVSIFGRSRIYLVISMGIASLLQIALLLYATGIAAGSDRFNTAANGRLSLGAGFVLSMVALLMVIRGCFQGFKGAEIYRRFAYLGVVVMVFLFVGSGFLDGLSIMKEYANRKEVFLRQTVSHLLIALSSVTAGALIGIPMGMMIYKSGKPHKLALFLLNLGQTIPTISLLVLLMIPLTLISERSEFFKRIGISGVGVAPAFIVLVIYAVFPIVHTTMSGLKMVDRSLLETASGMGMMKYQVLLKLEAPLSLPVIIGGVRTAMTQSVGNAILAGLIGGGGLGSIIFLGLAQAAPDLILLGVIPLAMMAFLLDMLLLFLVYLYKRKNNVVNL